MDVDSDKPAQPPTGIVKESHLRLDKLPRDAAGDRAWLEAKRMKAKGLAVAQAKAAPKYEPPAKKAKSATDLSKLNGKNKFIQLLREQQLLPSSTD